MFSLHSAQKTNNPCKFAKQHKPCRALHSPFSRYYLPPDSLGTQRNIFLLAKLSKFTVFSIIAVLLLSACTMPKFRIPRVHRITIQQGNLVTQDMIDKLKPGMSRKQVAFVLGEPVVKNPFNQQRWDYVYTVFIQPNFNSEKRLSIFFVDEHLSYFTGDFKPTAVLEAEKNAEKKAKEEKEADEDTVADTSDKGESEDS